LIRGFPFELDCESMEPLIWRQTWDGEPIRTIFVGWW
jgi:hypothetical protein